MINFSFKRKDLKARINKVIFFEIKMHIILCFLCFVLTIYFILVGILEDLTALICLFATTLPLIGLFLYIINYIKKHKRSMIQEFNNISKNDMINYGLDKKDGYYKLICYENNKIIEFKKESIKRMRVTKNLIIIKLRTNEIFLFPNQRDTISLFK